MKFFIFIALACISQLANANGDKGAPLLTAEEWKAAQDSELFRQDILTTLVRVTGKLNGLTYYRENYTPSVRDVILADQYEALGAIEDLVEDVSSELKAAVTDDRNREAQLCYLNAEKALLKDQVSASDQLEACLLASLAVADNHMPVIDQTIAALSDLSNQVNDLLVSCTPEENTEHQRVHVVACNSERLQQLKAVEEDMDKSVPQLVAKGDAVGDQAVNQARQCKSGPVAEFEKDARRLQENAKVCFSGQH